MTDKNPSYSAAIGLLKEANILKSNLRHVKHKRRIKYCLWFQEFHSAQRTIAGYESMHMIRKGQMHYVGKNHPISQKRFVENLFGVAA